MKTTKNIITITLFAVLFISVSLFNNGCGHENLTGNSYSENKTGNMPLPDSVSIEVTKLSGGYNFKLKNNCRTTIINDFHVQFDKTVCITQWSLLWQFDPNTTDLNHGKIGEKAGLNQPPVAPGQERDVLWIKVQPNGELNFNWQATKDGITVQSGTSKLPR